MANYPYTQADRTPVADGLLPDYYELCDELKGIRRTLNACAGYAISWNDPLWKREKEIVRELDRMEKVIAEVAAEEIG